MFLAALLLNVITSHCPQHFYNSVLALVDNPMLLGGTHINKLSSFDFGYLLYLQIFKAKVSSHYPAVPRRQPSCNTAGSKQQICNSIIAITRSIMATRALPKKEVRRNKNYYYQRLVAILCQPCPQQEVDGNVDVLSIFVLGADPLTAQEVVGVGTLLGAFPSVFSNVAEIGHTTATFKYLCDQLPSSPFSPQNYRQSTTFWINALSHMLGITAVQAEELTCKWVQFLSNTAGRFKDTIPPGIPLI